MNVAITEYLLANGERMEAEIAKALQMTMPQVRDHLSQLSIKGEVICCKVTRFQDGKKVEGTSYRLSSTRSGKPMQAFTAHKTR